MRIENGPHRPEKLHALLCHPSLWGVFVGGCIDPTTSSLHWRDTDGHAHVADEWTGWICLPDASKVLTPSGRPSALILHELAHIILGTDRHDRAFREMVSNLGAPGEAKRYTRVPKIR